MLYISCWSISTVVNYVYLDVKKTNLNVNGFPISTTGGFWYSFRFHLSHHKDGQLCRECKLWGSLLQRWLKRGYQSCRRNFRNWTVSDLEPFQPLIAVSSTKEFRFHALVVECWSLWAILRRRSWLNGEEALTRRPSDDRLAVDLEETWSNSGAVTSKSLSLEATNEKLDARASIITSQEIISSQHRSFWW